jgi:hypothetical protein
MPSTTPWTAKRAQLDLEAKLEVIQEKERARLAAEQAKTAAEHEKLVAQGAEKLSREELQEANAQLQATLADAEKEKQIAIANAVQARKASEDARAANARTDALLAKERAHVHELEAETKKIYDKVLR